MVEFRPGIAAGLFRAQGIPVKSGMEWEIPFAQRPALGALSRRNGGDDRLGFATYRETSR